MAGVLSAIPLGVGEAVSIVQSWHQYNRDETWAKRGYNMDLQGMRIDVLNTVREEMRDQVTLIIASLDNLMVVATLMFSIGFGFVVEGTFPPSERDDDGHILEDGHKYTWWQQMFLRVYAMLCTTSLCFPFWCMIFTMYIRQEVEECIYSIMSDLQRHLLEALKTAAIEEFDDPAAADAESGDEDAMDDGAGQRAVSEPPIGRGFSRAGSTMRNLMSQQSRRLHKVGEKVLGNVLVDDKVDHIREPELRMIATGLLQRVEYYHKYLPWAKLCLWLGICSNLLLCAVLLGLYLQEEYASLPMMWILYSGIVTGGTFLAIIFLLVVRRKMKLPLFETLKVPQPSDQQEPQDNGIFDPASRTASQDHAGRASRVAPSDFRPSRENSLRAPLLGQRQQRAGPKARMQSPGARRQADRGGSSQGSDDDSQQYHTAASNFSDSSMEAVHRQGSGGGGLNMGRRRRN